MRKQVIAIKHDQELSQLEQRVQQAFLDRYRPWTEQCSQYGMQLILQPCYYYNGKYHTKHRKKGCVLVFRILLVPSGYTYSQAKKLCLYKKFFTKNLLIVAKHQDAYAVTEHAVVDRHLERYLQKQIQTAQRHKQRGVPAVCETFTDILRSWAFLSRYRTEIKRTFRGKRLEWLYLAMVILFLALCEYIWLRSTEHRFGG